jgi:hypothetical protein
MTGYTRIALTCVLQTEAGKRARNDDEHPGKANRHEKFLPQ